MWSLVLKDLALLLQSKLNFTRKIDDEFKKTLFSMMQELQFALQGGQMERGIIIEEVNGGISKLRSCYEKFLL